MIKLKYKPTWQIEHVRDGAVIWQEILTENTWHDEAERWLSQCLFTNEDEPPGIFYLGLDARPTVAEGDGTTQLSGEPTAGTSGYYRQPVARGTTNFLLAQVGGDYRVTTSQVTFTAAGTWAGVSNLVFINTSTDPGILFATASLNTVRNLIDSDTLTASLAISISE